MAPSEGSGGSEEVPAWKKRDVMKELKLRNRDWYDSYFGAPDNWDDFYNERKFNGRVINPKNRLKWFDSPDNEKLLNKWGYATKVGVAFGLIVGMSANMLRVRLNPSFGQKALKLMYHGGMGGLAGSAYAGTVTSLTQVRGKEDAYHHLLGGMATSLATGPAWGHWPIAIVAGAVFGSIMGMRKYYHIQGWGQFLDRRLLERVRTHPLDNLFVHHDLTGLGGFEYEWSADDQRKVFKVEHYHVGEENYVEVAEPRERDWQPPVKSG